MVDEVLIITNAMICKASLPDFPLATEDRTESMRISTLDQLNRVLDCYVARRREEKMNMFRHKHECMKFESSVTATSVHGSEKESNIILDDKESAPLPRRECYEVSAGWRNDSSRLQEQTSAAKAAMLAQLKSARVKLVPFPVDLFGVRFVLGRMNGKDTTSVVAVETARFGEGFSA
jgi:hypothetical protein